MARIENTITLDLECPFSNIRVRSITLLAFPLVAWDTVPLVSLVSYVQNGNNANKINVNFTANNTQACDLRCIVTYDIIS